MIATRIAIAAVVLACATAAAAQTHAELLEKAIFTDETAGDLPSAIRIYERLLSTPGVTSEITTRAQARLVEGKRRRDQAVMSPGAVHGGTAIETAGPRTDVPRGAFQQFTQQVTQGFAGMWSGNYDASRPVTVRGRIAQVVWTNPQALLVIEGADGNRWGFTLPPPNALFLRGFKKDTFKLGEELVVGGFISKGETENCPTRLPNGCATLEDGALHASASIITAADGKVLFDWAVLRTMPAVSN
jgi:hypothetical protein